MIGILQFTEGDRTYECSVEERPGANGPTRWWWFVVTNDHHRYAPFPAVAEDTELSVRHRIVSYYTALIARRALPHNPYRR
jgi:hypothetical protein